MGVTGSATDILEMGDLTHMSGIGRGACQIKWRTGTHQPVLAADPPKAHTPDQLVANLDERSS